MTKIDLATVRDMDAKDPLSGARSLFVLPEGVIYLDGNSLGPLPASVPDRIDTAVRKEWGQGLIRSWNTAGWIGAPRRVGDKIGRLIGARPGEVAAADSTSVNLHKLLLAALSLRSERTILLSDTGNFPNDLYIAEGVVQLSPGHRVMLVEPEDVEAALDEHVAVLLLSQVDYRTGRKHDMAALTRKAHAVGALVLWDLCHSAGAFPVDLNGCDADLAVGCGYKYLNGGPGAPGYLYIAKRLQSQVRPALSGWMGHEQPFAFDLTYRPVQGIERNLVGTPAILGLVALEAAVDLLLQVDLAVIQQKSLDLGDLFIALVEQEIEAGTFEIVSPRDRDRRGSQVSLRHPNAYAIIQAALELGVIGDFRAPDVARFGMTPLYIGFGDIWRAVETLKRIMKDQFWRSSRFSIRQAVT